MSQLLLLKLGGELVETAGGRASIAAFAAATTGVRPLVIVHGGGRAVDAELERRSIAPRKVDGLRITDAATLEVVVAVLGGSANTELVAALVAAGIRAVGLTGVDAGFGQAVRVGAHRSANGEVTDLGFVGDPTDADPSLIRLLVEHGYVPVIASIGLDRAAPDPVRPGSRVLNVNADVMACRIASALGTCELAIAGATAGVLDGQGATIPVLDTDGIDHMIAAGTATAGMIAKLDACRTALGAGVAPVRIIDGRALDASGRVETAPGTRLVAAAARAAVR